MGSKPATTREAILDKAYERACTDGLAALDTRSVARECGVAVGTIYNYFPDMASLRTEVMQRFWAEALADVGQRTHEAHGEGALAYCRQLLDALNTSMEGFRATWLRDVAMLDGRTRQRGRDAEAACFGEIRQGIVRAIERDDRIAPAARERLDAERLASFIWTSMLGAIRRGEAGTTVLLDVLELALYR